MQPAGKAQTMLQIEIPLFTHIFSENTLVLYSSLPLGALWRLRAPVHQTAWNPAATPLHFNCTAPFSL